MVARTVVLLTQQSGGPDAVVPRSRQICRQLYVLRQSGRWIGCAGSAQFGDERAGDSRVWSSGHYGVRQGVVRFQEADSHFREASGGTEGRWAQEESYRRGGNASDTASATAPEVKTVNDFRPPEYRRAIVVFVMLNIRIGALVVTREGKGIRFTIPTVHSSTILTQDETKVLMNALVKEFKRKPFVNTQPDDGGV